MATAVSVLFALALVYSAQQPQDQEGKAPENAPPQGGKVPRQQENKTPQQLEAPERWNIFWQATSIGQYHGNFRSPYEGENSLQSRAERSWSVTSTLFLGLRLGDDTVIYVDPELAGGLGFSSVTGVANYPNGELTRVASVTPKPYLARAYIQHDFGWGSERESFESEENQLAGSRPVNRYTVVVGRFTVTDFFDNNRYSHDPRTQFMGWAIMYNGAWDYPADTRGYTWGWYNELHTTHWSLRYASALEPKVANGMHFDRRVLEDRGDMFEAERRYAVGQHVGAVRALGFLLHTNSGTYQKALQLVQQTGTRPDVTATRQIGTLKYGVGLNAEQELTSDIGVFARLGWNDGKTESFAFTAMDRLAQGGISVTGTRWHRHFDTAATALSVGGISGVHAQYLAAGGLDFIIGDGRLNYGPEYGWESYYSARLLPGLFTTFDLQRIANPAYNQDRGPVWVPSIRLHIELGK
jgi:high affinity Mn2+ porin